MVAFLLFFFHPLSRRNPVHDIPPASLAKLFRGLGAASRARGPRPQAARPAALALGRFQIYNLFNGLGPRGSGRRRFPTSLSSYVMHELSA